MSDKYMKNLTFANIAKACGGRYIAMRHCLIRQSPARHRQQTGEGGLSFYPDKGRKGGRTQFIPTVFEQGAGNCAL